MGNCFATTQSSVFLKIYDNKKLPHVLRIAAFKQVIRKQVGVCRRQMSRAESKKEAAERKIRQYNSELSDLLMAEKVEFEKLRSRKQNFEKRMDDRVTNYWKPTLLPTYRKITANIAKEKQIMNDYEIKVENIEEELESYNKILGCDDEDVTSEMTEQIFNRLNNDFQPQTEMTETGKGKDQQKYSETQKRVRKNVASKKNESSEDDALISKLMAVMLGTDPISVTGNNFGAESDDEEEDEVLMFPDRKSVV